MKPEDLISAIGEVEDRHLEGIDRRPPLRPGRRIVPILIAAALALAAAASFTVFALNRKPSETPLPATPSETCENSGLSATGDQTATTPADSTPADTTPTDATLSGETTTSRTDPTPTPAPTSTPTPTPTPTTTPTTTTTTEPTPTPTPIYHRSPPVSTVSHVHEWVTEKAVRPTCTFPGRTEGTYCAICSEVMAYTAEYPALGGEHIYENGYCTRCGTRAPNEGYVFELSEDGESYEIVSAAGVVDCYYAFLKTNPDPGAPGNDHGFDETGRGPTTGGPCVQVSPEEAQILIYVIPETYLGKPVTAIRATDFCPLYGAPGNGQPCVGYPDVHFYLNDNVREIAADSLTVRHMTKPHIHVHSLISWCAINESENVVMTEYDAVFWKMSFLSDCGSVLYLRDELLTEVVIPLDIEAFGRHSFCGNTEIVSVAMPSFITSIFDGAFVGCRSLVDYHFSWQVNDIGYRAFEDTGIMKLTIPPNVKHLKAFAFYNCRKLETVALPAGLERIGDSCFYGTALKKVVLPESLRVIDMDAFGKVKIDELRWSNAVATVGDYAFGGHVKKLSIDDLSSFLSCDFSSMDANPAEYARTVEIGGELFDGILKIPENVSRIGANALSFGGVFHELHFPATVTSCAAELFDETVFERLYVEDLSSFITLDFGISSRPESPFARAQRIFAGGEEITRRVVLPRVEKLGAKVFAGSPFEEIVLPEGLTEIGDLAFYECVCLKSVVVPDSVRYIGDGAFSYCLALEKATLPDCPCGAHLFHACYALESIENVSLYGEIYEHMFSDCRGLTAVTIPSRVEKIGDHAFSNCMSLTVLAFEDRGGRTLTVADFAFAHTAVKTVDLIPGLSLGKNCFFGGKVREIWIFEGARADDDFTFTISPVVHAPGTWTIVDGKRVVLDGKE